MVKSLLAMQETRIRSLGWEGLLEKEMATHSNILAWEIPWTEEPDRPQPMGSPRVEHDVGVTLTHMELGITSISNNQSKQSSENKRITQ